MYVLTVWIVFTGLAMTVEVISLRKTSKMGYAPLAELLTKRKQVQHEAFRILPEANTEAVVPDSSQDVSEQDCFQQGEIPAC